MSTPIPVESPVYSIEMVARITRLAPDRIVFFQRSGLVRPVVTDPELRFDDAAVLRLRRLAFFVAEYQVNDAGLRHLVALLDEVERLRAEVRFLRG